MIGKLHWIDRDALTAFILSAQVRPFSSLTLDSLPKPS
jgi:hypothetical protein